MTNPKTALLTASTLTVSLIDSLNRHRQQLHGKRIWLACSGGRDSLSLAHLCSALFETGQLPFLPQLVHVNHGMQSANAVWAQHVQNWAREHAMPCYILDVSVTQKTEQAARHARYEAIMGLMNHDDVLMLGHHRDDQVETVLMRLFNGAGINGLSGMREWTAKQTNVPSDKTIYLWRPWLTVSRAQITDYALASALDYIDDPTNMIDNGQAAVDVTSNRDVQVQTNNVSVPLVSPKLNELPCSHDVSQLNDRAWLRSVIMPLISERYPSVDTAISRTSQLMQDASTIIDSQVQANLKDLSRHTPSTQALSELHAELAIDQLLALSTALQSTIIHSWLSPSPLELSPPKRLVDDVLQLCQRTNSNHQTALHWDSSLYQYDIRRYQNTLYRLRKDWLNWLDGVPITQQLILTSPIRDTLILKDGSRVDIADSSTNINASTISNNSVCNRPDKNVDNRPANCPNSHENFQAVWQINGLQTLANTVIAAGYNDALLQFAPLPRTLKLSLANRVGRKSGKKLLQAISQPSFMRKSIVLMSILQADDVPIPIAIVCIDAIYVVKSPIATFMLPLCQTELHTVTRVNSLPLTIERILKTLPNSMLN